jgi:pyruvate/2-oxoglutarate dehydrogenase complex dihydrolipoamide acyltransferase (E2) component
MPSLGADMEAGTLVEWLKQPGDRVKRGDVVAVVETQKGAIEVDIFEDGVIERWLVEPGTTVPVGTALALIGNGEAVSRSVRSRSRLARCPSIRGSFTCVRKAARMAAAAFLAIELGGHQLASSFRPI